jgi:hypothetical protein
MSEATGAEVLPVNLLVMRKQPWSRNRGPQDSDYARLSSTDCDYWGCQMQRGDLKCVERGRQGDEKGLVSRVRAWRPVDWLARALNLQQTPSEHIALLHSPASTTGISCGGQCTAAPLTASHGFWTLPRFCWSLGGML